MSPILQSCLITSNLEKKNLIKLRIPYMKLRKALFQSLFILLSLVSFIGCDENSDSQVNVVPDSTIDTGCAVPGSANQTISVLLVGNSLMGGVKSKIETLLTCGGYTPDIGISNPGGYWLYQHNENATTLDLIAQGYDLVLLQEQSGGIGSHIEPYDTIASLKTKIEAAGSVMGFYQTWAFSSRDPVVTDDILTRYEIIGNYFSAPVIHIGRAWDNFYISYSESPPFSLFSDSVHANSYGQSLIAYVLYAYLTGETPVYLSSLSLTDDEALILQTFAWDIYQANL